MPVSHAPDTAVISTDGFAAGEVPGLLDVLVRVPDLRKRRGRRYLLVFVLAVAVACVLAGAKNFRETGGQAADLPQDVLARLGGTPRPLLRRIVAPSGTRIRTLVHAIGADVLDDLIGGWLRALADAGRPDHLLTAIAIDGKWLRGVADGQVKLFAAMLHEEKVMIAQHRIPDETTETTQVKELLAPVDLENAVVTADAAHAQRETAEYIAGREDDGGRGSGCFPFVTGNQPSLQKAVFDAIQQDGPRDPDHTELDYGHGRIIRRSLWVTSADGTDFPHLARIVPIRRDRYDIDGALISKETGHAVTSLDGKRASAADPARIARGQWGIESVHWLRDTAYSEDASTGYAGNGPRSWPRCEISPSACSISAASPRSPAPSRPSDATGTACSATYRYETAITNDFADPVAYYLLDKIGTAKGDVPQQIFLGTLVQASVVVAASLLGGKVSDRTGRRKIFVVTASVVYGLALFVVAVASNFSGFLVGMAISGLGFGVYAAVDLALVVDVLPDTRNAAKDLGVFNIADALPFSVAPAIAPVILVLGGGSYGVLYMVAGLCAIIGAFAILPVRRVR